MTQARAIPHFENGVPAGYRIIQIVPGSFYEKIGIKNDDVITGVNGDKITDPGQAFNMLNELKTANHLELQVKRNGTDQNISYSIH